MQDALRRGDQLVQRNIALGHALVFTERVHRHVEPKQVATLAWDHNQIAAVGRLHGHLVADIGKVGLGQQIHHAPGFVGRVAHQLLAHGFAHCAACAVAAHHVAGSHRLYPARVGGIRSFHAHCHGVVGCRWVYRHVQQLARVVRLQAAGGVAHQLQIKIVNACLVQHHMGELGETVFGVLHPAMAHDVFGLLFVGLPKGHLVDPAGFFQHLLAKVEGLKHLHRAAGNAIGLAQLQWPAFLLDDTGADVGEGRQLRCQRQPRRTAADDEHIHVLGCSVRVRHGIGRCLGEVRVTGNKTVGMELHSVPLKNSFTAARLCIFKQFKSKSI